MNYTSKLYFKIDGNHLMACEFHYSIKKIIPKNRNFPKPMGLGKSKKYVIFIIPQNELYLKNIFQDSW